MLPSSKIRVFNTVTVEGDCDFLPPEVDAFGWLAWMSTSRRLFRKAFVFKILMLLR